MGWQAYIVEIMSNTYLIPTCIRIVLSVICGGIIGLERAKSNQAAGMRTHMLVCLGAAMVMLTGQYMFDKYNVGDPARMGAQVISGIGFLGAGSIIVEGPSKVKGLTTAAGLWAAACIGLSIGIGYYAGAVIATIAVYQIMTKFRSISHNYINNDTMLGIYVEFSSMNIIPEFCSTTENYGLQIDEMQLEKNSETGFFGAIIYVKNSLNKNQDEILEYIKNLNGIEVVNCLYTRKEVQ